MSCGSPLFGFCDFSDLRRYCGTVFIGFDTAVDRQSY